MGIQSGKHSPKHCDSLLHYRHTILHRQTPLPSAQNPNLRGGPTTHSTPVLQHSHSFVRCTPARNPPVHPRSPFPPNGLSLPNFIPHRRFSHQIIQQFIRSNVFRLSTTFCASKKTVDTLLGGGVGMAHWTGQCSRRFQPPDISGIWTHAMDFDSYNVQGKSVIHLWIFLPRYDSRKLCWVVWFYRFSHFIDWLIDWLCFSFWLNANNTVLYFTGQECSPSPCKWSDLIPHSSNHRQFLLRKMGHHTVAVCPLQHQTHQQRRPWPPSALLPLPRQSTPTLWTFMLGILSP